MKVKSLCSRLKTLKYVYRISYLTKVPRVLHVLLYQNIRTKEDHRLSLPEETYVGEVLSCLFVCLFVCLFIYIPFSQLRSEMLNLSLSLNSPRKMHVINVFKPGLTYHDKNADINLIYLIWKYAEIALFFKLLSTFNSVASNHASIYNTFSSY
jgi:hypothetical protein